MKKILVFLLCITFQSNGLRRTVSFAAVNSATSTMLFSQNSINDNINEEEDSYDEEVTSSSTFSSIIPSTKDFFIINQLNYLKNLIQNNNIYYLDNVTIDKESNNIIITLIIYFFDKGFLGNYSSKKFLQCVYHISNETQEQTILNKFKFPKDSGWTNKNYLNSIIDILVSEANKEKKDRLIETKYW